MTGKRFTEDEMKLLNANSAVKMVFESTVVLRGDALEKMYEGWRADGNEGLMNQLKEYGLAEILSGSNYVEVMVNEFHLRYHSKLKGYDSNALDIALAASGLFKMHRATISWTREIRNALIEGYPETSFEEGIRRLGISPEIVGASRINSLKQTYDRNINKQQKYEKLLSNAESDRSGDEDAESGTNAYIYIKHPYVSTVTGKGRMHMKGCFFNEASIIADMPIDQVLKIYEIDASLLNNATVSQIHQELLGWRKTQETQGLTTEIVLRIQINRSNAMLEYTDKVFADLKTHICGMKPSQKKALCQQIATYPTSLNYPYGYSMRQILEKIGISKTTYYKALNSKSYGMADERRAERDAADLAQLMRVADYKGFEKGIRQIYMMMPDITGEQFAISKIRRLLRNAGIKTKVRGENPARQRAREFHERNTKPNLLKREFRLHRPNEVRLTDVTYLDYGHTSDGKKQRAYGSSCVDPVTGRLIAFNISANNDVELALETVARLSDHPAVLGALFHSDQGILYLTDEFQAKITAMGMVQSMSKRGNCWDNAPQESFFGHFKDECHYEDCETFEELQAMIDEYSYYYNYERHQWSRNRMTPVEYESYMNAMTEDEFEAYMEKEREKYANMKAKAEQKAIERAKTLGV